MGFDVTYHPITREEMHEWYFEPLRDDSAIDQLAEKYGFLAENYRRFFRSIHNHIEDSGGAGSSFESVHGLMIASVQGLFRRYDYFRGSLFTNFVAENSSFKKYVQSFSEIVPDEYRSMPFSGGIEENWCGGVYISPEAVAPLLGDNENDPDVHKALLKTFGDEEELERFLNLLKYAEQNGFGILEATEVVVPIVDGCNSDFNNCETDFMDKDKPVSVKPFSVAPYLTDIYDPSKEEHEGKYLLDDKGNICQSQSGNGVQTQYASAGCLCGCGIVWLLTGSIILNFTIPSFIAPFLLISILLALRSFSRRNHQ